MADLDPAGIYAELGVTPIINAIGSLTLLGGSTPPREVKEAMEAAESAYVSLTELEERAGAYIARLVDVPAAYVTSGAGSALTLVTAALMAGDDDDKIQQLPDTTGMKDEILIQRRRRYWYDRCLELAGARLVEFGSEDRTTAEDLERAIGPQTVAVHCFVQEETPDDESLSLEETLQVANAAGLPVIVDAAGQIYPLENIGKYVRMGAAFQCVAAKYIGAPQSTGFALGSEDMIRKLALQSFASYEGRQVRGVGRPQKVDRQEIVGAVAAVKRWMTMNHEERLADAESRSEAMRSHLAGIPGVDAALIDNIVGHNSFGVRLRVDQPVTGVGLPDIVERLKKGNPPVWTRVRPGEDFIALHVFGLHEGEEYLVGERIAELFD
jgi:D-glucosaminate-6-phosphate ammonia-lyase